MDVEGGIEDAAVSCFIDKLERGGLVWPDLVAEVKAGEVNLDFFGGVGEESGGGGVDGDSKCYIGVEISVRWAQGVFLGATSAGWGLHRAGAWAAADDHRLYTGFVVHHFHEKRAGRGTQSISKLSDLV